MRKLIKAGSNLFCAAMFLSALMMASPVMGQDAGRIMLSRYPQASYPTLGKKIAQALRDCKAVKGSCVLDALDQTGTQDLGAFDPGPGLAGVTLYLGQGTYAADSITLRPGMHIVGLNENQTIIQAKKTTTELIVLPAGGPVYNVEIANLALFGVPSETQRAIYLNAQRSGPPNLNGGLWYAQFRNLKIFSFTGDNVTIRGSQDDWWGPMQWINWEHVIVQRTNDGTHLALKITGETGQMRFVNCEFDAVNSSMTPPRRGNGVFIGQEPGAKTWPVNVQFDLATIQGWNKAVVISHADNINFITPHFESDDTLIEVIRGSRGVVAEAGVAWSNSCQGAQRSGYCFFVDGFSSAAFRDFTICCKPDKIVKAVVGAKVALSNNTSWEPPRNPDDVTLGEEMVIRGSSAPSGSCANGQMYVNAGGGPGSTLYVCEAGSWKAK